MPDTFFSEIISTTLFARCLALLALKQVPSDIRVLQTENGQITFEINDSSSSNITWLFNGNPIQPSTKYQMEIITQTQIILHINQTDSIDSGTYTAVIENGMEKLLVPVKMIVRGNVKILKKIESTQ